MAKRRRRSNNPWAIPIAGGIIGTAAVLVFGASYFDRRRRRIIAETLGARGYRVTAGKDAPEARFADRLPDFRTGRKGVVWSAVRDEPPRALLEHRHTTGAGKSRQVHGQAAIVVPCPPEWPALHLQGESVFDRLGEKMGLAKDLKLGDEPFDKRWRVIVKGDDSTALALLSPAVRAALLAGPRQGEWWYVNDGLLAVGVNTTSPTAELFARTEARLDAVLEAMDPELRDLLPAAWAD